MLSGTLIEERDAWNDRRETKMTYLFDKIGIADVSTDDEKEWGWFGFKDSPHNKPPAWQSKGGLHWLESMLTSQRWAAHNFGPEASLWNKVTGDLPTALPVPLNWLEPMRDRIVLLSESAGCTAEREHATVPVVTYIDR